MLIFRGRTRVRILKAAGVLVALVCVVALTLQGAAPPADALPEAPRATPVEKIISKVVASLISRHHFSNRRLDDQVSREFFDEYFDRLDHNRSFLLASDVEEFRSYEVNLDDLVLLGNLDFAYDVYARFLQRVRERVSYVNEKSSQPTRFDTDETMQLDRSDAPWCRTREELDELWERRIKNNLLVYELMNSGLEKQSLETDEPQAMPREDGQQEGVPAQGKGGKNDSAQADAKAPETALAPGEKQAADASPAQPKTVVPKKTPEERVRNFYTRYLRQMENKDSTDVLEIFLTALTRVYDPHSAYMAPDTEQDFDIAMKLSLQGIGALLTTEDSFVKVAGILPGGPAEMDGRLKEGDRIIAVAQEGTEPVDVIDMPLRRVVKMIRGKKETKVYLTVLEAGKGLGSVPSVIDILRDEVKLTEQEAKSRIQQTQMPTAAGKHSAEAAPSNVAVIMLPSFYTDFEGKHRGLKDYKSSTRDVRNLIEEAKAQNIQGLILDLRSNGGGGLAEAVSLTGLFIDEGPVVQQLHKDGRLQKHVDPEKGVVYGGPLVVLVDRLSASASEIVAAAIQDYGRGIIIGEKSTHGKGTVQTIYHLDARLRRSTIFRNRKAGSLKFTVAKFYRVNGGSTQVKGVTPDFILPSLTDDMELGDAHLPHALPWDEIDALTVSCNVDVRPLLPTLCERMQTRLAGYEQYQELLADVQKFAERRQRKTLSLNQQKRVQLQKEEEEWSKRLKQVSRQRSRRSRRDKEDDGDEDQESDLVMKCALDVMGDLILLGRGDALPPLDHASTAMAKEGVSAAAEADVGAAD